MVSLTFIKALRINESLYYLEGAYPDKAKYLIELELERNFESVARGVIFGVVGGVISVGNTSQLRIPLIYDLKENTAFVLKKWGLNTLLKNSLPVMYDMYLDDKAAVRKGKISGIDAYKYLKSTDQLPREMVIEILRTKHFNNNNQIELYLFRQDRRNKDAQEIIVNNNDSIRFAPFDYTQITYSDYPGILNISSESHFAEAVEIDQYKTRYYFELQFDNQYSDNLNESDSISFDYYKKRIDYLRLKNKIK